MFLRALHIVEKHRGAYYVQYLEALTVVCTLRTWSFEICHGCVAEFGFLFQSQTLELIGVPHGARWISNTLMLPCMRWAFGKREDPYGASATLNRTGRDDRTVQRRDAHEKLLL